MSMINIKLNPDLTVRPVIFSTGMASKLWQGLKTETRRLSTSPLRRVKPGDLLYVRESIVAPTADHQPVLYLADDATVAATYRCTPSIHMKRIYSRMTLLVEDVSVHPIRAITEASCEAEGAERALRPQYNSAPDYMKAGGQANYRNGFRELWNSLHNKEGETWLDNPEVVAIRFQVIRENVDTLLGEAR